MDTPLENHPPDINSPARPRLELSYRMAHEADLPLLRDYRAECGWGLERLEGQWGNPDRPLCILSVEQDGQKEDIGMGGWVLNDEEDQEAASRATHTVELCSLYIRAQHQRGGLGSQALLLLERLAFELFQATAVTLDAVAYWVRIRRGTAVLRGGFQQDRVQRRVVQETRLRAVSPHRAYVSAFDPK
ncbi:hypothetical protein P7C73_g958, partial [Tremellales sp. Uapishka_1]